MDTSFPYKQPEPKPEHKVIWKGSHLGGTLLISCAPIHPTTLFFVLSVFDIYLEGHIDIFMKDGAKLAIDDAIEAIDMLYEQHIIAGYTEHTENGGKIQ